MKDVLFEVVKSLLLVLIAEFTRRVRFFGTCGTESTWTGGAFLRRTQVFGLITFGTKQLELLNHRFARRVGDLERVRRNGSRLALIHHLAPIGMCRGS